LQGRYTWRHNAVLRHLVQCIQRHLSTTDKLYSDLEGFCNPGDIFTGARPDIAVSHNNVTHVLELTCCYERNFASSKTYKENKYADLGSRHIQACPTKLYTLEISSLGFVNYTSLNKFCKNVGIEPFPDDTIRRLGELALRCSYYIFCCRHKDWPSDISDPYVC